MRISDWSSDVCSSDLHRRRRDRLRDADLDRNAGTDQGGPRRWERPRGAIHLESQRASPRAQEVVAVDAQASGGRGLEVSDEAERWPGHPRMITDQTAASTRPTWNLRLPGGAVITGRRLSPERAKASEAREP